MKVRNKKRELFVSILSIVLCITLLLGSTFAWFTSTATSTGNRILSGGMGVELYKYDEAEQAYTDISNGSGDIFADEGENAVLWEPGHTEIVFLQVKNAKSLALVYNLILDVALFRGADGRENLTLTNQANEEEILTYAVLPGMTAEDFATGQYQDWQDLLDASSSITGVVTAAGKSTAVEGRKLAEKGACDSLALAVHMDEDAGNAYQGCEISIDVDILAKQMAHEYDSFSNQYDADALFTESSYDALVGTGDMERANQAIWLYTGGANKNRHGEIKFVKDDGALDGSYYMRLTNSTDKCYYTGTCTCEAHKTTPIERQCVHLQYKNVYTYLETDKEYTLNFWIKQSDIDHPANIYLDLPSGDISVQEVIGKALKAAGADTWCEISYKFKIEEEITSSCKFSIRTDADAAADSTVCIDNIRLYTEEGQIAKDEKAFKAMLEAEKEVSMLPDKAHDPFEAVDPVSGTPDNYLTNGTFDADVEGWTGNASTTTSMYSWVEGDSTSDGGYFKIDNEETKKAPAVKQNVYNIVGGAEYQIKFDYKIDPENTSTVPEVKIECWNTPVDDGDTGYLEGVELEWDSSLFINDGEWHTFSYRATVVERTEWVEVFLRHTKNTAYATTESAVYYDNVSFTMTDTPDVMSLNPMKIFYSDMDTTDFIATLEFSKEEYGDGEVLFEVYDGQDKIFESDRIQMQDYTAQTSFDLGLMTKKGSPYALVVSLYVGGELKSQIGQNIFVYDRPVSIDEDGNYVKFGKDFIPVLGYHVFEEAAEGDEDVFANLSEAGITVIGIRNGYCKTPEKVLETLDRLEKYGLKGIVSLYMSNMPAGHEDNMLNTIKIVSDPRVRNHPALFGYNISDEPYLHDNDAASVREDLENSYRLIRQYDTDNVITFVENLEEYIGLSSAFTDGIILDVYCDAADLLVYHDLSLAREVVAEGRSYWGLLATYVNKNAEFNTPDDVRNNNYQAFFAGAAGIGYFSISDSGNLYGTKLSTEEPYVSAGWADHVWDKSQGYIPLWKVTTPWSDTAGLDVWNALKSFKEKEQPILTEHFVAKEGQKLIEDINIDDGYMYYSWAVEDGKIYLAVLDVKGSDVNVNVSLKGADGNAIGAYTATLIAGREEFEPVTGTDTLNLALTGVEALLFEITEN